MLSAIRNARKLLTPQWRTLPCRIRSPIVWDGLLERRRPGRPSAGSRCRHDPICSRARLCSSARSAQTPAGFRGGSDREAAARVPTLVATIQRSRPPRTARPTIPFGFAPRIRIRRVQEIDARLARSLDDARRLALDRSGRRTASCPRQSVGHLDAAPAEKRGDSELFHCRRRPSTEHRQGSERQLPPLPADRLQLAVVLDRVDERVEPLQQLGLDRAGTPMPKWSFTQHDLDLVVLARGRCG